MNTGMEVKILGPGSFLPGWVEEIEAQSFPAMGHSRGRLGETEYMFVIEDLCYAWWHIHPTTKEAYIRYLVTDKDHRRMGFAKRLLMACQRWLANAGVDAITAHTRVSNIAAQKLNEKLGWKRVGDKDGFYSNGEEAILWRLEREELAKFADAPRVMQWT